MDRTWNYKINSKVTKYIAGRMTNAHDKKIMFKFMSHNRFESTTIEINRSRQSKLQIKGFYRPHLMCLSKFGNSQQQT